MDQAETFHLKANVAWPEYLLVRVDIEEGHGPTIAV
jgi:hypothetical protein